MLITIIPWAPFFTRAFREISSKLFGGSALASGGEEGKGYVPLKPGIDLNPIELKPLVLSVTPIARGKRAAEWSDSSFSAATLSHRVLVSRSVDSFGLPTG
ncbi:uncharacterized protein VTP21DRAFT_10966 [Calcarisporiella thermophila]|uniref:uncharacterized protein n=1 Tax=Calcarisporiella thermophila TaxID=911321 RepID=UPI003744117D